MNFIHAILLGIIQGLTEFIPVSSTAHLLMGQRLLGLPADDAKEDSVNEVHEFSVFFHHRDTNAQRLWILSGPVSQWLISFCIVIPLFQKFRYTGIKRVVRYIPPDFLHQSN